MKKNNVPFLVGTLLVASLVAVRCGGDDTTGGGASGSGGSGGAGGGAGSTGAGMAGTGAGMAGSAGSTAGGGGTAAGGGGSAGMAGTAGGSSEGGITDAGDAGGACPAQQPAEDAPCAKKQICPYGNTECACAKNGAMDAGRGWVCVSTDGGIDSDAAACPATPVDGEVCATKGQRCPVGDAGARCVCAKGAWNCP
jgi:hypothetical protein